MPQDHGVVLAERLSVIRREDDERLVEQPARLQLVHQPPQLPIQVVEAAVVGVTQFRELGRRERVRHLVVPPVPSVGVRKAVTTGWVVGIVGIEQVQKGEERTVAVASIDPIEESTLHPPGIDADRGPPAAHTGSEADLEASGDPPRSEHLIRGGRPPLVFPALEPPVEPERAAQPVEVCDEASGLVPAVGKDFGQGGKPVVEGDLSIREVLVRVTRREQTGV